MSYRLKSGEELAPGFKRIAREQMDDALAHLTGHRPGEDLDEAVHESRKCFKKVRGLLRLLRQEIGETVYQRENVCFRDAGRLLADMRDSAVMIHTLDKVLEKSPDAASAAAFGALHETLVIIHQTSRQRVKGQ